MLVDPALAARLLGVAPEALVVEDQSTPTTAMWRLSAPGEDAALCARLPADPDRAANEAALLEALDRGRFPAAPRLLGLSGQVTTTRWLEVPPALGHHPPPGAVDAAVDALANLHSLPLTEGSHWGKDPEQVVGPAALPLHRLGFAAIERDSALPALEEAHTALLASPFGFTHGGLTADHLHFAPDPVFTSWGDAGFGPQLFDLIALLWTLPLTPETRRSAVERYAGARSLPLAPTGDVADLLAIRWGLEWLMALPRKQVESLGDDVASSRLLLIGSTIENAIREPSGGHPAAVALRRALWPR